MPPDCVCRSLAAKHSVCTVAIGAQAARGSSRVVRVVVVQRQGEAGMQGNDRADLPTAYDLVDNSTRITKKLLALADRQFVNGIGSQVMRVVVVARCPFRLHIVDVLPIRRCRRGSLSIRTMCRSTRYCWDMHLA